MSHVPFPTSDVSGFEAHQALADRHERLSEHMVVPPTRRGLKAAQKTGQMGREECIRDW